MHLRAPISSLWLNVEYLGNAASLQIIPAKSFWNYELIESSYLWF